MSKKHTAPDASARPGHKRPDTSARKGSKGKSKNYYNKGKPTESGKKKGTGKNYLYGIHAVEAALLNPKRAINKVFTTLNAAQRLDTALSRRNILPVDATPKELDALVGNRETVHQGVLAEVTELPLLEESALLDCNKIMVLDQITDPHNVGAIMRSAAAFGVEAIILTKHHSPPLTGIVSKTACGAVDLVPVHMATNLVRCLKTLGKAGFAIYGLDSEADNKLEEQGFGSNIVLVMGAEDTGLRRLTRENCDMMCHIQTGQNRLASLNVSNAAAVALHTVLVNGK